MTTNDMIWNAGMTLIWNEGKKEFNTYDIINQVKKMYNVSLDRSDAANCCYNLFKVVRMEASYTVYSEK